MGVNLDKTQLWKKDVAQSVDMYNRWFVEFAPSAFRETRVKVTEEVDHSLKVTRYLRDIAPSFIRENPGVLSTLRMCTCPPLAVDRLGGLASLTKNFMDSLAVDHRLPPKMPKALADACLARITDIITRMADPDIFVWLERGDDPTEQEQYRAATIVADRLCGSVANPIVRNAQETRQLTAIKKWLEAKGYTEVAINDRGDFRAMAAGTFSFRHNVEVQVGDRRVNIPVDAVVMPASARRGELPLLIEAKSAGDFTNTNKRRKEEATKVIQLKAKYGKGVRFILFLCGYFDTPYLGYEAAEGIDWAWEHRIDDLALFGL